MITTPFDDGAKRDSASKTSTARSPQPLAPINDRATGKPAHLSRPTQDCNRIDGIMGLVETDAVEHVDARESLLLEPIRNFIAVEKVPAIDPETAEYPDLQEAIQDLANSENLQTFLSYVLYQNVYGRDLAIAFKTADAVNGLAAMRMLRSTLGLKLGSFLQQLAILARSFDARAGHRWQKFAELVQRSAFNQSPVVDILTGGSLRCEYASLKSALQDEQPHAVYPTSPFRESAGNVVSTDDFQQVEAVMSSRTFTSIKVVQNVLDKSDHTLRNVYKPLGRCVCLIDPNVEQHFGQKMVEYFRHHGIELEKMVYRAMEVDKGINTVERMLGDFKLAGVARNEPVLIVGGGVLSDTGGLACSLYHRGTPYVMLSTSLVAGIDAGPSPRTCCDGFGYKNLFGSYHPPILSITDRSMFATLKKGWLRHGVAEIIKMATVKDERLFEDLEVGGRGLIETRFGSVGRPSVQTEELSRRILGRAIKSYVESEYGNLYETHQCRPHAFGHTWSPGFEIPAGMLHGHAVSVGMGFGAFLSLRQNWITDLHFERIANLIASFDLSLWHPILEQTHLLWEAQVRMIEKRGGNLAAPIPQGQIGDCGYLNDVSETELKSALADYRRYCANRTRGGRGIEVHCADVGLEDPSTVGGSG